MPGTMSGPSAMRTWRHEVLVRASPGTAGAVPGAAIPDPKEGNDGSSACLFLT